MCGIVGMIGLHGEKCRDASAIYHMMSAQKHRGPDDKGAVAFSFYEQECWEPIKDDTGKVFDGVLGFNRLSILDLSAAGHQPMIDTANKVALVFNGEIYNAFELKEQYFKHYAFNSQTDTEVILKLYIEFGFDRMIRMLNGMFALCLVDIKCGKVYIARDRFGIIPLYTTVQNGILYFASEYKSITALPDFQVKLDLNAIAEYLNFRSLIKRTMAEGIESFQPGTYICITKQGIKEAVYYDLNQRHSVNKKADMEKLDELLCCAVKRQLISDVPVGCQLSGGIDSSLISAIVKKYVSECFDTVSIIFDDARFTEEKWIDMVGKALNVRQHKLCFDGKDFINLLKKCVWHEEAVLSHPSTMGIYQLTKNAKNYVTVLLSGEGSDECFAGYPRFGLSRKPEFSAEACIRATTTIPTTLRKAVFPDINDVLVYEERKDIFDRLSGTDFDRQRKYEMLTYYPELLVRQNKMSMANSIENRVPFLDNDLVEYVLTLDDNALIKSNEDEDYIFKAPLKEISENIFGAHFTHRKKIGFSVPVQNYIQTSDFAEWFCQIILPSVKKRGVFDAVILERLYRNISITKYDYHEVECFWRVLTAEIWCQLYLKE